ncbi:hypothetical protein HZH68_009231 [Vespula germanica]|uniref:Uncharacterized protein n=3 Tax=Vespula TaxID=7451 RepID=A0A834JVG5_VESGE|nr:hypothetical protein HZH66_008380 [Vespula vulgaris]KAF7395181.1 hypothetical protein HZH68_009231 [Vespula germanica]KAF7420258.1 hypothetical protein H0235_010555 [Vespula pensylvanica]
MRGQSTSYTRCLCARTPICTRLRGHNNVWDTIEDHEATHHLLNPEGEWEDVVEGGPAYRRGEIREVEWRGRMR